MTASLKIDVLTLFPKMMEGFLGESMIGRAQARNIITIEVHDLRRWAKGKHKIIDDRPFGGGAGMLLKPEPLFEAVAAIHTEESTVIYLCPDGEPLKTPLVQELSKLSHLLLISGHYEGVDQRVRDQLVDREISIGDYILTNGTLAAAVLIDSVSRYIPGFLGEEISLTQDSFHDNLLSFPQYTRPAVFQGFSVPPVLLSGDHQAIVQWRHQQQLEKTKERRPDIFKSCHNK